MPGKTVPGWGVEVCIRVRRPVAVHGPGGAADTTGWLEPGRICVVLVLVKKLDLGRICVVPVLLKKPDLGRICVVLDQLKKQKDDRKPIS